MGKLTKTLLNGFTLTVVTNRDMPFLNRYGLLDKSGKRVLKNLYHAIWELNDYLIGFRWGTRFGIIGKNGNIIIDPILKGDINISEGSRKKDEFMFGEEFYTREWNSSEYLIFDLDQNYKSFLISKKGKIISNGQFDTIAEATQNGFCLVANNDKWGLFSIKNKKLLIDTIFPHGYLNSVKKGSSIVATIIKLGGKTYRLNERKQVFEIAI